jgi:hypothetical protein
VKEGETLEMSASVKDITDGNPVVFQVWKAGQDVDSGIPVATIVSGIEGGVAKAVFKASAPSGDTVPDADPEYFFSAHSAWCRYKKSGNATVELKRPELANPEWKDKDGNSTGKGLVGKALTLSVSCNGDTEEGAGVIFKVYPEGADPERDSPVAELASVNKEGKAGAEWNPTDTREKGDTAELKYFFTADAKRSGRIKSPPIAIKNPQIIEMKWEPGAIYQGQEAKLYFTTFETVEFSPKVKVQLWEHLKKNPEKMITEQEVTVDKDEMELSFETLYDIDDLDKYQEEHEYEIQIKIASESLPIKECKPVSLIVGVHNVL